MHFCYRDKYTKPNSDQRAVAELRLYRLSLVETNFWSEWTQECSMKWKPQVKLTASGNVSSKINYVVNSLKLVTQPQLRPLLLYFCKIKPLHWMSLVTSRWLPKKELMIKVLKKIANKMTQHCIWQQNIFLPVQSSSEVFMVKITSSWSSFSIWCTTCTNSVSSPQQLYVIHSLSVTCAVWSLTMYCFCHSTEEFRADLSLCAEELILTHFHLALLFMY